MTWWWLSFCDNARPAGQQFVGAALVEARTAIEAERAARALGCHGGGGDMLALAAPASHGPPPAGYTNRLLSRAELEVMQALWTPNEPGLKTLGEYADEGDPAAIALTEGVVTS